MSQYRRMRVPGGTVYFEVCLAQAGSDLLVREVDALRWAVGATLRERPVEVLAWVVLPDRMHAIWRLPEGDSDYALRWGAIKGRFTASLRGDASGESGQSPDLRIGERVQRGERGIWQKRFWEHHLRGAADLDQHLDLCRQSPVAAGLVERWQDWRYSSFVRERLRAAG